MISLYLTIAGVTSVLLWFIQSTLSKSNDRQWNTLPGPPRTSFIAGNLGEMFDAKGMKYHEEYVERYGTVFRVYGLLGEKQLFLSDPQAIGAILADEDMFTETKGFIGIAHLVFGRLSLFATKGHQHRKLRKMLNPVFTTRHIKGLTGVFQSVANKLCKVIETEIKSRSARSVNKGTGGQVEMDIYEYVSCAALDLIGLGGIGYEFRALDGADDPYVRAARHLLPTVSEVAFVTPVLHILLRMGPRFFRRCVVLLTPSSAVQRFRRVVDVMDSTARSIFIRKKEEERLAQGFGEKEDTAAAAVDMISLTLRENTKYGKLTDEEIIAQISVLVFSAFDTTSGAIVRTLQMLAEKPDIQRRLREEIVEAYNANDNVELDFEALDGLEYLNAVCSETLRLFPPVPWMSRISSNDTVLPLMPGPNSKSASLPIAKGTTIYISISGVNRNPEIWGIDSHEYRPERWLEPLPPSVAAAKIPSLWSSVLSFSAGPRGCIGFRFGLLELKVVLASLIRSFVFERAEGEVEWLLSLTVSPHVKKDGVLVPGLPFRVSMCESSKSD